MSINCVRCIREPRTGGDLLCDKCRGGTGEWPVVRTVTLDLCEVCLCGVGGICHVPGCAMHLSTAPDLNLHAYLVRPTYNELKTALADAAIDIEYGTTECECIEGLSPCVRCNRLRRYQALLNWKPKAEASVEKCDVSDKRDLSNEFDRQGEPFDEKCRRCDGCGKIANSENGEPWTQWASLPPGSDLAVRMGIVAPIPCPDCCGDDKR